MTRKAPLVTWGALKRLTEQASQLLGQEAVESTPERYFLALIACVNKNSLLIVWCLLLCVNPGLAAPPAHEGAPPANVWVRHAAYMFWVHGANVTLIYEPPVSVATMSFLPTPFNAPEFVLSQLQRLSNETVFADFPSLNQARFRMLRYQRALPGLCFCCYAKNEMFRAWRDKDAADHRWGLHARNQTHCLDRFFLFGTANSSFTPNTTLMRATMEQIYQFLPMFAPNLTALVPGGSICGNWLIRDPDLWFFWGGGIATNYHPGNYQCASLGYLTMPMQVVRPSPPAPRRRREALGPGCSDTVVTDAQVSGGPEGWGTGHAALAALLGTLTLGSYPGVIAQENRASIIGLTCRLEDTINATSRLIRDLQTEMSSLHQVQLQHRFALDFLLARQGGFCKIVGAAACAVRYQDLGVTIEDEMAKLQQLVKDNVGNPKWDPFAWLTSWLPDAAWIRQLLFGLVCVICIFVSVCCCIQCVPNLVAMVGHSKETLQRRAMYYAYNQLKTTKGEM